MCHMPSFYACYGNSLFMPVIEILWFMKKDIERSENVCEGTHLVPVSRKTRKLIGPVKPFLVICFSKRKQCIGI